MKRGICPACRLKVAVTNSGRVDGRHYCLRAQQHVRQQEALPLPRWAARVVTEIVGVRVERGDGGWE